MQTKEIRTYLQLLTLVLVVFASTGCFSRQRFSNYGWQLDSLKYYTRRLDSLLVVQSTEIAQLSTDLYTKTNELSQKFDMLNSRLGESETQITQLYSKINPSQRVLADSEAIAQVSPETRLLYESAYKNYVKGNYQQAIDGFGAYQKAAHDGPLVDNALYWIGESHAALGQLQRAVNALQELVSKYPNSPRVPTALYRMGIIYEEAKDQKSARYYYNQVIRDFPNSPEAALARSKLQ